LESAVISQQAAILSRDIAGTQRRIIEEFEMVPSWSERYETLIEFGRRLAPMPISLRVDRNRIRNCHGQAWLAGVRHEGRLFFSAASEADVVAGLLAIVVEVYSGSAPDEILFHPLTVLEATGLRDRLSPHRVASYTEIMARLKDLVH
jgi:cysteine desulfuration protein SufE